MKKGMNPEAVQQLVTQTTTAGEDVRTKYDAALARVEELDWTGEDADRYRGDFADAVGQVLQQVLQGTADFAQRAASNAQHQSEASGS